MKWRRQRARNGYSDFDTWGFDTYLAGIIAKGCRQMAREAHGHPPGLDFEDWIVTLNQIANGFEAYLSIDDIPVDEFLVERIDASLRGMQWSLALMQEWFPNLWD